VSCKAIVLSIISAAVFTGLSPLAGAQGFPSKPITIIVPYAPGALADTTMRLIGQKVSESIAQPVRTENRPGGGGVIGAMAVKNAAPDGYTLLQANISSHAANKTLMSKLPYDPIRDFKPITLLWTFSSFLVVPGSAPVKSVADLVALAQTKTGGLSYVSTGNATGGHLLGEMFRSGVRVPMVHVPYKGAAPAILDLVAGRADFFFASYSSVGAQVAEGKLRAIAVASPRRLERFPGIPTLAEAGYSNVEYVTWFGLVAPAATPDTLVSKLNEEFTKAARSPELVKRMADEGVDLSPNSPAQFGELMARDIEKLRKIVAESGAKVE
jgi:tripartite-type tricarboxylate transporter receptor subunit TctC